MDLIFRENKQRFVALQEVMSHLHAAELDTFDDVPGEKQICDNDRNSREEHRHGGLTHCELYRRAKPINIRGIAAPFILCQAYICFLCAVQSVKEIQHQLVEDVMLFYAADMTALLNEAECGIADLLLGPLHAVDEEIILLSGYQQYRQLVFFDDFNVFLQLELCPEQFAEPHPECRRLHPY